MSSLRVIARSSHPSVRRFSTRKQLHNTKGTSSSKYSGYDAASLRAPSKYGWRYHVDNTFQFILWASFGSAAIHLINMKQKYAEKERRLSTKIAILKDIIKRVGEGEDVDVAKELKVGKTEEEREWEEVINSFREEADLVLESPSHNPVNKKAEHPLEETASATAQVHDSSSQVVTSSGVSGWFWR